MPDARRKHVYSEIKESLFGDLVKPLLKNGGELPSKKELAQRYGVNIGTLDKALQELSVEGYIEKRMGSGTYVLPQAAKRGVAGVYCAAAWDADDKHKFNSFLDRRLQEALAEAGCEYLHYPDMRLERFRGQPPRNLVEDIAARKIDVLLVNGFSSAQAPWLEQLKIPVFRMDRDYGWGSLSFDMKDAGQKAASLLASKGCRKIELVSSIVHEWEVHSEIDQINRPLRAGMANALRPIGLQAPEAWLSKEMLPEAYRRSGETPLSDDEAGRLLCLGLFRNFKPDGLVVYTDILVKGVLDGLDELGLVPGRDVQVVSIGSRELEFPWLKRVLRVDASIAEIASSFLVLLASARANEAPREIPIKYSLN